MAPRGRKADWKQGLEDAKTQMLGAGRPQQASPDADREPIWMLPEPGSRRAAYTRDQIAAAALAIGDREGYSAISMRRVASELGAGTMTLYHYLRDKEDLLALIDDAIVGEVLIPDDQMTGDWRDDLAEIGRRTREAFRSHRWTSDMPPGERGGPNGLRHFEQSLRAVEQTGLSQKERLEMIALVDDFVFGSVTRENALAGALEESGAESRGERIPPGTWSFLDRELQTGRYPAAAEWLGDDPMAELSGTFAAMSDPERFERGLQTLLDGIELRIAKANKPAKNRKAAKRG
jgi:AcrR family transcriptional regulator